MNIDFSLPVDTEILLKLPALEHAQELFALVDRNRQFLRECLPWVDYNLSVEDSRSFIEECRKNFEKGQGFSALIFYQGKLAGTVGLHQIDMINKKAEVGYWLSQDHHGKGIMRRSCCVFISYVFEAFQLHRIEISCAADNRASQRIPEDLGFKREAILREATFLNGKFIDTIIYALLSTDKLK